MKQKQPIDTMTDLALLRYIAGRVNSMDDRLRNLELAHAKYLGMAAVVAAVVAIAFNAFK